MSKQYINLNIKISEEMKFKIKEMAALNGIGISAYIKMLISKDYNNFKNLNQLKEKSLKK